MTAKIIKLSEESRDRLKELSHRRNDCLDAIEQMSHRAGTLKRLIWAEVNKEVPYDKHVQATYKLDEHSVVLLPREY